MCCCCCCDQGRRYSKDDQLDDSIISYNYIERQTKKLGQDFFDNRPVLFAEMMHFAKMDNIAKSIRPKDDTNILLKTLKQARRGWVDGTLDLLGINMCQHQCYLCTEPLRKKVTLCKCNNHTFHTHCFDRYKEYLEGKEEDLVCPVCLVELDEDEDEVEEVMWPERQGHEEIRMVDEKRAPIDNPIDKAEREQLKPTNEEVNVQDDDEREEQTKRLNEEDTRRELVNQNEQNEADRTQDPKERKQDNK